MYSQQKPTSKDYGELIHDMKKGIIQIPKFQRDFVWNIEKTADLLDSIIKGYPIGTFILWETSDRLNNVKKIGSYELPEIQEGRYIQYVLDGQQRIASLFAVYMGIKVKKDGEKKETDYKQIYVNLDIDIEQNDENIISSKESDRCISLHEVLNFTDNLKKIKSEYFEDEQNKIHEYHINFQKYDFSIILLKKEDIDSAIEVFTRINTGGQNLTLFEIMAAKTYSEEQNFDMQDEWKEFTEEILAGVGYENIRGENILNLLSLVLSGTKECKRATILKLDRQSVIEAWPKCIDALEYAVDYFRANYSISVSRLLSYDTLLVIFAYFFCYEKNPNITQQKYLQELFWKLSLSFRYARSTNERIAQDIKRIDKIIEGDRPNYDDIDIDIHVDPEYLIKTEFSTGNSFCKAILGLLSAQKPKNFSDGSEVILDNDWLKISTSRNYHHFFPRSFLKKEKIDNENSLINITLISDRENKNKIDTKPPAKYIDKFKKEGGKVGENLKTHFIELDGFGIENNDYELFLKKRAQAISAALKEKMNVA